MPAVDRPPAWALRSPSAVSPPVRCCHSRGWFYAKTGIDPLPSRRVRRGEPCGCGPAIGKLADSRRVRLRRMRSEELPFLCREHAPAPEYIPEGPLESSPGGGYRDPEDTP